MWNYRVITKDISEDIKEYGIYEVFYNEQGEICAHSENPELVGESMDDLFNQLSNMVIDVDKHVVDSSKILELGKIKFHKFCEDDDFEEFELKDIID